MSRVALLLALTACGFAQESDRPPFRDTAVIPTFRKADPQLRYFRAVSRTRADDSLDLLLICGSPMEKPEQAPPGRFSWSKDEWLGLFLQERERPERVYQLSLLPNGLWSRGAKVLRASPTELVLALYDGLDRHDVTLKFFVNPKAKALVKRIDYRPFSFLRILHSDAVPQLIAGDTKQFLVVRPNEGNGFEILPFEEAKPIIAGLPVETWTTREEESVWLRPERFSPRRFGSEGRFTLEQDKSKPWGREWSAITEQTGATTRSYSLPQSTWAEFARARPGRVRDGYREQAAEFAEEIGPVQLYDGRLWFGKTFYDAEGTTGVGGFGYFDVVGRKFTLFSPPGIHGWSVSALLVEQDAVWLGLAHRGEYATSPGGLLKWSPATEKAQLLPLEAGINAVARYQGKLLIATGEGISVLTGDSFAHYLVDQTRQGGFQVVKR